MHRTTGNFYFKLTTAGHLIGEYFHHQNRWALPECAFRVRNDPNDERLLVQGDYTSTWYEPDGTTVTAALTIAPRPGQGSRPTLFDLTWRERQAPHQRVYLGQAMLNDGLLIGNYTSADSAPDASSACEPS